MAYRPTFYTDPQNRASAANQLPWVAATRGSRFEYRFEYREQFAARKTLAEIFRGAADVPERDLLVREARLRHGYAVTELADFLGLHYSTVSKIIRQNPPDGRVRLI